MRIMITVAVLCLLMAARAAGPEGNWPSFRGKQAGGVAEGFATPVSWDVPAGKNLRWKTPIRGMGHSSPIVWGDRVYVTSAISGKADASLKVGLYGDISPVADDTVHQWMLYCLNKETGEIMWERLAHEGVPAVKRHTKATHANSTPATDGKHLVAFFGSEGLFCFDMDGKPLWEKQLGVLDAGYYEVPEAQWEFGSSPIIAEGKVIVQCDVQKGSFLAAFNVEDGSEIWRVPRDDVPTWSTPTVAGEGEKARVLVNGYKHAGGYELASGKEVWRMRTAGDIPVPTPVIGDGLVYLTNAHGGPAMIYAVRLEAQGDVSLTDQAPSNPHVAWSKNGMGAYMQTPLVYRGLLYSCKDNGVLVCLDAVSGKKQFTSRLGSGSTGFTASGVAADGKLYFTSEEGDVYVVKAGPAFELLGTNPLGETCLSTPAVSEGTLFFHTRGHLVAVGETSPKQ